MAKSKNSSLPVRMITPEFRVAFPHVFKTRPKKDGNEGKYEIKMLFPKNQKIIGQTLKDKEGNSEEISLLTLLKNAKIAEFGEDQTKWPKNLKSCVIDGDDEEQADMEGFAGHWAVKATAHADARPSVVDKAGKPIEVTADFYPGCYARAAVYARVWKHEEGGMGVRLVLDHVQKLRDGKTFGGRRNVSEVFDPINTGGDDEAGGDEMEDSFA